MTVFDYKKNAELSPLYYNQPMDHKRAQDILKGGQRVRSPLEFDELLVHCNACSECNELPAVVVVNLEHSVTYHRQIQIGKLMFWGGIAGLLVGSYLAVRAEAK